MGRLKENVIDRIKRLISLGSKDYQIVEEVGVSRQTVAKYRRIVLEEIKVKAAARVEEERRRRKEREKEIRDHQIGLARARALKRQEDEEEEAQAEVDRLQNIRIQRKIQKKKKEQKIWSNAITAMDSIMTKAEAADRVSFMETYDLLYTINEEAVLKGTKAHFPKILENFDFPFTHFVYTEEERQMLPMWLSDRVSMDLALKIGLWPHGRDPLTEMIEAMKALNEPQEDSDSFENTRNAILREIIMNDPFIFYELGRRG
jgi:hypothetical protein